LSSAQVGAWKPSGAAVYNRAFGLHVIVEPVEDNATRYANTP
jgi:hypothetical protein